MLTRLDIKDRIVFKQSETITKEDSIEFIQVVNDIKNLKSQLAEKKILLASMLLGMTLEEKAKLKLLIDEVK